MRKSDLEKLVKEQGERIERLGIIPKSKEIAQKLGNGGSCSKKWASADYKFEGESLRIHYEVYAMGDQEIQVDYAEEHIWHEMFHAKEGSPIKFPNPLIVHDSRDNYEILKYKPGSMDKKDRHFIQDNRQGSWKQENRKRKKRTPLPKTLKCQRMS